MNTFKRYFLCSFAVNTTQKKLLLKCKIFQCTIEFNSFIVIHFFQLRETLISMKNQLALIKVYQEYKINIV